MSHKYAPSNIDLDRYWKTLYPAQKRGLLAHCVSYVEGNQNFYRPPSKVTMSSTSDTTARYSTGVGKMADAPQFSWEFPVPDNDFWRSFRYPSARNFRQCFTEDEIQAFQLNERHGTKSPEAKQKLLIKALQDHMASKETGNQTLCKTDNAEWVRHMMAIVALHSETGDLDAQIKMAETLREHADNPLSHEHSLASMLIQRGQPGDFQQAENFEGPFLAYVDKRLGQDSPQSLSSRRITAKAVWMQDRQVEAKALFDEIFALIDGMGKGEFAVYQDSERKMTQEMLDDLKTRNSNR
jgi:hypothetical protein